MNKNKKIATILTIVALAFAFTAIFMGFANGIKATGYLDGKLQGDPYTAKFFDVIFNKDNVVKDLFLGKSNAGLIITFVLTLITVGILGTTVALNLTGKATKKVNKGLMITSAVLLLLICVLMIASKGICVIPDEETWENPLWGKVLQKNTFEAGPICWAAFSGVAGVSMIVAAVQNKKAA